MWLEFMRQTGHIAIIAVVTLMPLPSARATGLARIYVYAQLETPAGSWIPISCDGTVVAKLRRGRFFAVNLAPGRHTLSDEKGIPVFVDARSGEESFVRLDWHIEVDKPGISVFQVVPPPQARDEMRYLVYIDAGKALSRSVPKKDPREQPQPRLMRRDDTD
jgi:hypothetical protein